MRTPQLALLAALRRPGSKEESMFLSEEQDAERIMVEAKIQRMLLELDEKLMPARIFYVEVDTRNYANMRTEIRVSMEHVI